jgi:glycosyltransferase involved in cell wall biosynthesis
MIEFSVALHTFNRAHVICETIDSVLAQTLKPKEVVVVDDGSIDNTQELLMRYGNQITYKKISNVGAGASRQVAVNLCSGEWIACCDDDDIWSPDHLATLAKIIETYPEISFCFNNFEHFGECGEPEYNHFLRAPNNWWESTTEKKLEHTRLLNEDAYLHFLEYNPAFPSTWAFKKDMYKKIGGINSTYSRMNSEDADLTRRMLMLHRAGCSDKQTVKIRKHGENMSISHVDNLLGKAKMLNDYLGSDFLPAKYHDKTETTYLNTMKHAVSQAIYNQDYLKVKSIVNEIGFLNIKIKDRIKYLLLMLKQR